MTVVTYLPRHSRGFQHIAIALRYLLLCGVLVGVVGAVGHWLELPLIASAVGPTAYLFVAHPEPETSRAGNALIGHTVAVGAGVGALVLFGLLHHASVSATGAPSFTRLPRARLRRQ